MNFSPNCNRYRLNIRIEVINFKMKKVTLLAWLRTIRLLIKHRFNLEKARSETDRELTDTVSETILKRAYKGREREN